ncbi:MAG TPA: class I SAM-dependent methyltransferase [Pyrinomonadaceae bacterium]|nr:class I SAM-dependent methyltransferase [Pyrinomonadaceae bacterium]
MTPTQRQPVAAAYDHWAETYDVDANKTRELAAAVLRRSNLKLSGRDVIEIGCGTGSNTEWLAEQARSVHALDFSEGMLRHAKARVRSARVRFVPHDIRSAWPVADASADVVVAMLVLEHVEHLEPIFAEASRALRSGGELYFCELHPFRQMSGSQAEFTHRATGRLVRVQAFLHDVSEYLKAGTAAGFELMQLDEWRDPDAQKSELPRLLSVNLRLRLAA